MTTAPLPHMHLFPNLVSSNNSALAAALQALPDYGATDAAKRRIAEALRVASADLLTAVQGRQALVKQVTDTARADKPQPSNLAKRAASAADAIAQTQEAVTILQDADNLSSEGRDRILTGAPAALMSHLNDQLQGALAEARACGLGHITTADEAIDAGKVDAWKTVTRLTATASDIPGCAAARGRTSAVRVRSAPTSGHIRAGAQLRRPVRRLVRSATRRCAQHAERGARVRHATLGR